jgi:hypothetical protein
MTKHQKWVVFAQGNCTHQGSSASPIALRERLSEFGDGDHLCWQARSTQPSSLVQAS